MKIYTKIKKCMILLMTLFMIFNCFTISSSAAGELSTFRIEGNVYTDISQNLNGNGWSWNASEYTLTLNGYNDEAIMFIPASNTSKTLKLVVKNNNTLVFDRDNTSYPIFDSRFNSTSYEDYGHVLYDDSGYAALLIICDVELSGGGTLNLKATNSSDVGISFNKKAQADNITFNSTSGYYALGCYSTLSLKNCTLNLNSPQGFTANYFTFENSKFTFKNTCKDTDYEAFGVSKKGIFKACTIDVTMGAKAVNNTTSFMNIVFNNCRADLDNTVLNVKVSNDTNSTGQTIIYDCLYPEQEFTINITNGSKIEFDSVITSITSCVNTNISNSTIKGVCDGSAFRAVNLNITNSVIDVVSNRKGNYECYAFEAVNLNIKNSKIKAKASDCVWKANSSYHAGLKSTITLTDSEIDFQSEKPGFGDSYKLNYTDPSKWQIESNGKITDWTVNSLNIDFARNTIAIKPYIDNTNNQSITTTSTQQSTNNADKDSQPIINNSSSQITNNNLNNPDSALTTDSSSKISKDNLNNLDSTSTTDSSSQISNDNLNNSDSTLTTQNNIIDVLNQSTSYDENTQDKESNGKPWLAFIIIIVIVLVGIAATVVYLHIKKNSLPR